MINRNELGDVSRPRSILDDELVSLFPLGRWQSRNSITRLNKQRQALELVYGKKGHDMHGNGCEGRLQT